MHKPRESTAVQCPAATSVRSQRTTLGLGPLGHRPLGLIALTLCTTVQVAAAQPRGSGTAVVGNGAKGPGQSPPSSPVAQPAASPSPANDDGDEPDDEVGEHDGTIVRIEGDLLYFDVGGERGLRVGQSVRVLRTIIAKHPVTGKRLVDHFPLGTLIIEGVGSVLSYGRAQRRMGPLVKIGDVVNVSPPAKPEVRASAAPPVPVAPSGSPVPSVPSVPSAPPAVERGRGPAGGGSASLPPSHPPSSSPEIHPTSPPSASEPSQAQQAQQIFERALGRPLAERIQIFETFLGSHPDSPFRAAIEDELTHLRTTQRTLQAATDQLAHAREATPKPSSRTGEPPARPIASVLVPRRILAGDPLEVAVYVGNPGTVKEALLYVRREGDYTYQRLPFSADATGYYRILVPPRLRTAGTVELFVGLIDTTGRQSIFAGTAEQPSDVVIEPPIGPPPPPGPNHSAVSGFFEFVDFNRFRGNDYYFNAEADFMYRLGGILYSVRTGFGTLSGYGESVANLDERMMSPRPVGINYGYVEGELRFHRLVGLAARGLAGQSRAGAGGGAELKLRIGSELGTNLIIGGAIISDFGALAQLKLEWNVIRNWPMSVTVVATNQPVQTDLGVRLIYQVGWRFRSWFAPTARIGYDVRNINHGGLSVGLGVVMGW
ncbi:MAG TPA: hypothetical protein PKI03_08500 [Pseudomonadota bacterium]|nr:hypothetical protein [Pseudomonadota bacterium]